MNARDTMAQAKPESHVLLLVVELCGLTFRYQDRSKSNLVATALFGLADTWVSPSATGYTATTLLDGSAASAIKLGRIKALRVGLILRTNITADQAGNSAASVTLFSDLGTSLTYTRSLGTAERAYRYRTAEATIPLRNTMMVD